MLTDLRFALNLMRRRPFIAAAVILTLGIGIGANTAIFRAFNAAFLRPLPFAGADRLVRIVLSPPDRSAQLSPRPDVFLALRDHNRVFSSVTGQRYNDLTLTDGGTPQQIAGIQVSERWAETLGIAPQLGRVFTADEERQGGGAGVALISDAMWRTRFGGQRDALGRSITLNGRAFTIVGVLPPGVRFPYEADVWLPARFEEQLESTWALNIVGRLRDDVSHEAAVAMLQALSPRLEAVRAQHGMALFPIPLRETLLEDEGPIVVALTFASAFLLLLVAVNVANLLTVQSLSRQREFAVRSALGATFGRHLRQTLTEGLVLATAGGAAGVFVSIASTELLSVIVPENFAYVSESVPFDERTIAYLIAVVLITGLAFGAIPALRTVRRDPQQFLIGSTRTTEDRPARWRAALATMAQIALALVLLAGAHAAVVDVRSRLERDRGLNPRELHLARVALPAERYAGAEGRERFFDALMQSLAAAPGVEHAGTINLFPGAGMGALVARLEGEGVPYRAESPLLAHNRIVHGPAMEAMRVRLLKGRLMTADELQRGEAVAVISRQVAESFWPGQDPIGKRIRNRRLEDAPWLRVVGVVDEVDETYADTTRSLWTPLKMNSGTAAVAQATIVIRSQLAPDAVARSVRRVVARIDPQLALYDVATVEATYRNTLRGRESARTLSAAFGLLGLIVAAIGVYASMAFATSRRTREIAVRIALGATPDRLARHFLRQTAFVIAGGLVAGIAATFLLSRVAASLLGDLTFGVASLAVAAAILAAVTLVASMVPLRRAMRLDPSAALQSE